MLITKLKIVVMGLAVVILGFAPPRWAESRARRSRSNVNKTSSLRAAS